MLRAIDRGFQSLGIPVIFILCYRIYYVFRTTRLRSHLLVFEERGISETHPTFAAKAGKRTWATLVGSDRSSPLRYPGSVLLKPLEHT